MTSYLLHHLLDETAKRFPDRTALISKNDSITYAELNLQSDRLALSLTRLGVKVGDRVGLMLEKSFESVIGIFGILKAGAAYVPIDPQSPLSRVKFVLKHCNIRLLVTSENAIEQFLPDLDQGTSLEKVLLAIGNPLALAGKCHNVHLLSWADLLSPATAMRPNLNITDTTPAYILHTSGSTGTPKGVAISHLNSLTFVDMAADFFEITEGDRLASHAPFHFDLSVFDLFVAVKCGAAIALVPENLGVFPMRLAEYIEERGITVWNSVASVVSLLVERGKLDRFSFASLRLVIFSGDVLPAKHLRIAMTQMPETRFLNTYGQTEANSSVVFPVDKIPHDDSWRIPIGKPFPNFEAFALNDDTQIIKAPGETGELHIRSSSVAMGYWEETEKTSKAFVKDPRPNSQSVTVYKTGDLVTIDNEGNFIFIGRRDRQVKSRGYRIQMDEIESILNNHPAIKEAVVIAIPDDLVGNRLIAYVSSSPGNAVEESDLFEFCGMFLPRYMLPEVINFVETLPKTPTGKTDRKRLQETAAAQPVQRA